MPNAEEIPINNTDELCFNIKNIIYYRKNKDSYEYIKAYIERGDRISPSE